MSPSVSPSGSPSESPSVSPSPSPSRSPSAAAIHAVNWDTDITWKGGLIVRWENLQIGDIGAPHASPTFPIKSIQVVGTFGGATVVVEGSNMPETSTYDTLYNQWHGAISLNAAAMRSILGNCYFVRPRIVGGDATTDLDVYLLCVTER